MIHSDRQAFATKIIDYSQSSDPTPVEQVVCDEIHAPTLIDPGDFDPFHAVCRRHVLRVRDLSVAGWRIYLEFERWRISCPGCDGVRVEHLDWLAKNPRYSHAPQARIIFDKFHMMRHLSQALDEVRRREYQRLSGQDRSYIKGQRYTLLSRRENLSLDGRRALKKLLQANRRLNTAYLLKEAFGQLWDYRTERGARAFFERWQDSLKWQRLEPYRKFAAMIESHWDGIASYCHPKNKVSLGFVEGINNKIRVLQRRAYGYRDEDYLKLKIVAAFLPPLPRNANINPLEYA